MRYLYEYKYTNGKLVSGHNLEKIEVHIDYIKLLGVDIISSYGDYEESYWSTMLNMNEIEYLKIEPMKEESDEY